jgi:hypothetical protein
MALVEPPLAAPDKPRLRINYPLAFVAIGIGCVGLCINGLFAWSRGVGEADKTIFLVFGVLAECGLFLLPASMSMAWRERRLGAFALCTVMWPSLFCFALFNSLGFASVNLDDTATARAERISPAIEDAKRKLDTVTASRKLACGDDKKIGTRCFALRKDETRAMEALSAARAKQAEHADPQTAMAQKLIAWISRGYLQPTADDLALIRLLMLTVISQTGGLLWAVAVRPAPAERRPGL